MERVTRRFWTWAVSLLALCVILGAVVSGLFQLAVLALPSYRNDLSAWVTDVAGRPVQIGGVTLVWRGIAPRLDLSDITLYDDDGDEALSAERLSLRFSLWRLVTGEYLPSRVELAGLSLAVDVDEDGRISIAGIETLPQGAQPRNGQLLEGLRRFQQVRLENCEVRLTHARLGRQPIQYTVVRADIDRTFDGFDADGELRLPSTHGGTVSFSADINGDVATPAQWSGDIDFDAEALQPRAWLAPWLAPGTQLAAEGLELRANGHLLSGRFDAIEVKAAAEALIAVRGDRRVEAKSMKLAAILSQETTGWHAVISEFSLDGEPQLRGSARLLAGADGAFEADADAEVVHLTRLAPLLGFVRGAPDAVLAASRASGDVENLVLRVRRGDGPPRYSLRATLKDIALRPDRRFGFSGMNATLTADESGGQLTLDGSGVNLQLPQTLAVPVPFDALRGAARWTRGADGWRLTVPDLGWRLAGSSGKGRVGLLLPDAEERSPEIDLAATFSADDATRFKVFMPLAWGPGLQGWLDHGIQGGRVPRAELAIRGPLHEFPFVAPGSSGQWKLDLDVAAARLDYLDGWPPVDNIAAHLAFRGNALDIEATSATVLGNPVSHASARFADFRDHQLTVEADVSGETARFYQFLRASPLRTVLAGLVNNTSATGPSSVGLRLDIPIAHARDLEVSGTVGLQGVDLQYKGLAAPIAGITGDIAFTGHGITAHGLHAQFEDLELTAAIEARAGTAGVVLADFLLIPQADGAGASSFVPPFLRPALSGQSRWRAELPLGGADTALILTSDLDGTAIRLPPPLGKSAAEKSAIRIAIGGDAQAPVRVRVNYGGQLGADIALASTDGALKARAVSVRLGGGDAPPAQGEGLRLGGELPELDFAAWAGALKGPDNNSVLSGLAVREAELTAGRLTLGGRTIGPTHLAYLPQADGWRTQLKGAGAEGQVTWSDAGGGRVTAALDHVALEPQPHAAAVAAEARAAAEAARNVEPASDPAALPVLDLDCAHFVAGGDDLGHLVLRTSRIANGQKIDTMTVSGGKLDAEVSGQWRRSEGKSSADARFTLSSSDIATVLQAFEYSPTLSAKDSRFTGDLVWPPTARGIEWEQAAGHVGIEVHNGVMKTLEPGAGRVLGLINFYALPRRLTLDFRDVVSSGLSFDKISGGFDLADGAANTTDMKIEAPSLRMEMKGRVGLVARDYDQQVSVYPDVSAGVTLGALLLGGPALGALVLLAQEVLDKPLDQVTQLSYRLTGSWDNPKVEKLAKERSDKPGRERSVLPPIDARPGAH